MWVVSAQLNVQPCTYIIAQFLQNSLDTVKLVAEM